MPVDVNLGCPLCGGRHRASPEC